MCVINESLVLNTESYIENVTIHCVISRQKTLILPYLTKHNCLRSTKLLNTLFVCVCVCIYIYMYIVTGSRST